MKMTVEEFRESVIRLLDDAKDSDITFAAAFKHEIDPVIGVSYYGSDFILNGLASEISSMVTARRAVRMIDEQNNPKENENVHKPV